MVPMRDSGDSVAVCFNPLQIGESINRHGPWLTRISFDRFQSPSDRGVHQQVFNGVIHDLVFEFQSPSDRGVHQQHAGHAIRRIPAALVSIPFRSGSPSTGRHARVHGDSGSRRVSIPFRSGSPSTAPKSSHSSTSTRAFQSPSDRGVHQQTRPGARSTCSAVRFNPLQIGESINSQSVGRLREGLAGFNPLQIGESINSASCST